MKIIIIKVVSTEGEPDGASLIRPTVKQFWSFVGRVSAAPPGIRATHCPASAL